MESQHRIRFPCSTQTVLDLFTIREHLGRIDDIDIGMTGVRPPSHPARYYKLDPEGCSA